MNETRSTCPYCGVGCGVIIESDGAQVTGVRGDPEHPANFGRLCSKGQSLHLTASVSVTRQTRLLQPMRRDARGAVPQAIGWDAALDEVARRFANVVQRQGPDAIGLYVSGQLPAANAGDDIQSQTTSAMNAVKAIVEAGGSSMENVTKCTVFLISQADFAGMNQAYVPFFPTNPPARSTVVVAALVRAGAKIEVECIATIPR